MPKTNAEYAKGYGKRKREMCRNCLSKSDVYAENDLDVICVACFDNCVRLQMNTIIPPPVYDILKRAVNGQIQNFTVALRSTSKKGDCFSGKIFFVTLRHKSSDLKLNYVVKVALPDLNIRTIHPVREAFINEINFYAEVWPKLLRFQERIPSKYHFVHLPKCLATNSDENLEMVVLEDLKFQEFIIHDKKKPFDKATFEFIFKIYGRFHALSFAYKALDPAGFSALCEGVTDVWSLYLQKDLFRDVLKSAHQQCFEQLQPGVDDDVIEKYKHYIDDGLDLARKSLVNGKYTAILHGDCWSNNMLFKYDHNILTDMRLLDFQNVRVGSPVCDLSYCLYAGGTKEAFDDLDHLLQVYHDSLSESLIAYGCDPQDLYPLEVLKGDWIIHGQLGAAMGISMWRGKLTDEDSATDLSDASSGQKGDNFFGDKFDERTYRQVARDIIYHLYNNNYLL